MKTGRNDPCPCGSGKKYKKCCIDKMPPLPIQIAETEYIIQEKYKALFDVNEELRAVADNLIAKHYTTKGLKEIFTAFSLGKACKTHGVVMEVCKKGYGEDAAILVRSMFELAITTLYILKDSTEERVQRYMDYDWVLRKNMYDHILTRPEIIGLVKEREASAKSAEITTSKVLEMAQKMQEKHKYERYDWSDKSIKKMAEEVGKANEYATVYNLQSQIEHTAVRVMNDYVKVDGQGFVIQVGPSDNWVSESLVSAFNFLYDIAGAYDKHHEAGYAKQLDEVAEKWIKAVDTTK